MAAGDAPEIAEHTEISRERDSRYDDMAEIKPWRKPLKGGPPSVRRLLVR